MKTNFAESYLIELLGSQLLLDSALAHDARYGIENAIHEFENRTHALSLERLADALERHGTAPNLALVNLLNTPLGPLWVREALMNAKQKLAGQTHAHVVIVGLWQLLKTKTGRRTPATEKKFNAWRDFVEGQLATAGIPDLTILWVG